MAVKMINALMGNVMYVPEERVQEYLAAGHKLAADSSEDKEKAKKPVKKSVRKREA